MTSLQHQKKLDARLTSVIHNKLRTKYQNAKAESNMNNKKNSYVIMSCLLHHNNHTGNANANSRPTARAQSIDNAAASINSPKII